MVLAHNVQSVKRTDDIKINTEATFESLMLSKNLLDGLTSAGFYKPSPIQLLGIPLGKLGLDLILEAKSGTGKTVVFTTIALQKLNFDRGLQIIIVTPTREIAAQICDVLKQIGSYCTRLNVEMVIGGLSFKEDLEKLKNNVHILVGTPGRIVHLMKEKHIVTNEINLLILDEADKLMENSFGDDILYIHSALPREKQIILSSATYPDRIAKVVNKIIKNPHHVCPDSSNVLLGVSHRVTFVKYNSNSVRQTELRFNELTKILSETEFKQCVIFCKYQARVSQLHKLLTKAKWPVELVYGKQEQTTRLEALKTLQEYKCRIIISTDLLSRGIDSKNVDLVINFEPPDTCETYLHRIGRSGRYGSIGMAISILCEGEESVTFFKLLAPVTHTIDVKHFWNGEALSTSNSRTSNWNETFVESEISNCNQNEIPSRKSDPSENFWTSLVSETVTQNIESFNQLCNSYNTITDNARLESFSDLLDDFIKTDDILQEECEATKYRQMDFVNFNYKDGFDAIKKLKDEICEPFNGISETENGGKDQNTLQNGNLVKSKTNSSLDICNRSFLERQHNYSNPQRNEQDFELELPKAFHESKFNGKTKKIARNKKAKVPANTRPNLVWYETEYRDEGCIPAEKNIPSTNEKLRNSNEIKHNRKSINSTKVADKSAANISKYKCKEEEYNRWFLQLKLRMNQIETLLYIEEMNK
ncbi:ATP-dependent RNA helicase dhh1 [Pieris rapae]|uniref:ATP-dependent RNA helicase dhh1 n=1 Tax=Pieris rapae TaxID=64459 RepID=UPI001E27B65C|nr:ATP-dependent RNA helicase dhh1 [Pieris rapae]